MTLFKSMVAYFRFFTRIYIPGDLGNEFYYLNHGSKFLPVFGLLIGLIEASIYYLCALVVHAPLAFMVVLLADVCLTGAMHQDGFADLSDGIFSSRKQDRMLEIMKDSRLGTMGALALIFYYLFMVGIFTNYVDQFQLWDGYIAILLMHMVGKSDIVLLFYKMKYRNATHGGLGQIWSNVATSNIVIAQVIAIAFLVGFYQVAGVIIYLIQVLFLLVYRRFILKKLGGFSGDSLGGVVPMTNVIFLFLVGTLGTWL